MGYYDDFSRFGVTPGFQGMAAGGLPYGMQVGSSIPAYGAGYGLGSSTELGGMAGVDGVASPVTAPGGLSARPEMWSMDNWFGTKDRPGMAQVGLGVAGGTAGLYLGLKQYGLMKKSLAENRRQFDMNWGAQTGRINTELEDRQRSRVAANPSLYEGVDSYMARNRIR
jgi:hypothetical protein